MNLVKLSEERIAKFGETTSLVYQGEAYTNIRIDKMGCRLAAGLKSLGVGRGDHVVVSMPNSPLESFEEMDENDTALMAFVVKMPGEELTESAVIDFATSKITPFKAPSKVKFVEALPKSLVGKILKKKLRNMV